MKIFLNFLLTFLSGPCQGSTLSSLLKKEFEITDKPTEIIIKMLEKQPFSGNSYQSKQMNSLLPLLMASKGNNANSKELLMMMMMQPDSIIEPEHLLPLMFDEENMDFKSMFLLTAMVKQSCDKTGQMNLMAPLLLQKNKNATTDNLMMMLMMQSMGSNSMGMLQLLPFLADDDADDEDSLLMMTLMNSMTGGMNTQGGFDNGFNMMMPLLMKTCSAGDEACEKKKKNLMVVMMAMQSQAPDTGMGPNMMLPMMLMDKGSNNEDLIFFMMMNDNKPKCEDVSIYSDPRIVVESVLKPVYQTWRNNEDGTRTLIDESIERPK